MSLLELYRRRVFLLQRFWPSGNFEDEVSEIADHFRYLSGLLVFIFIVYDI